MTVAPIRVLVVEGPSADAAAVARELRAAGYRPAVHPVSTESDFLAALNPPPDLVVCDFDRPSFGLDRVLAVLDEQDAAVPVVVAAAAADPEAAVDAVKRGATDFVLKDRLARLGPAVKHALEHRHRRTLDVWARQTVTASEARLHLALDAARTGVWEWDVRTNAVFWSAACHAIMGVESFGGTFDDFRALLHPDDAGPTVAAIRAALAGETTFAAEFRVVAPAGAVRWLASFGRATYDGAGRPVQMVGTLQDITDRKRTEDALNDSEARFQTVWEAAFDAMRLLDEDGVIVAVNAAFCRLFGMPREALVGRPFTATYAGDRDWAEPQRRYRERFRDRAIVPREERRMVLRDGRTVDLEVTSTYIELPGHATHLLGVIRDVTERKRAEAALRASEERFRAMVESTPECVKVVAADGTLLQMNPAGLAMLGATAEQAVGRCVYDLVVPHQRDAYRKFNQQVCGGKGGALDFEMVGPNGVRRHMETRAVPLPTAAGAVAQLAVTRDVTDRRNLEAQLRQAQKMEAVGQLAGGVAHDFNNLLTVIIGYSSLLLESGAIDYSSSELIEEIKRAGERSAGLTRQLLAFSRQQVLAPKILNLNTVVADTEKMLRRLIGEDVRLSTSLAPNLDFVWADAGQVEQVLLNLVVNARDAMPTGGKLTIETANVELDEHYTRDHADAKPGPHVLLAVSDTGCGMRPEVKARVFDPFFTTKGPGKGTGLGLSTVYGIVKQSGGLVGVYSEVGIGTTFKIYLPRTGEPVEAAKARSGVRMPPRGSETVLLVEDEDGVRGLTRHVLTNCGYAILEASDGEEALRVAAQHGGPIDILVTDVVMPGLGGREVSERLLATQPGLRVLFLSGYTDDAVVRHGVLHERVNFLQKPFSPMVLAHKVREVLDEDLTAE